MAYSITTYTGNGATTEYSIGFNYLATTHIVVTLDAVVKTVGVDYTIDTGTNKITFTVAPSASVAIKFARVTPKTVSDIPVTFSNGSVLTAGDLNRNQLYTLYVLQESIDNNATFSNISFIDEDNMVSDSATAVPSQQSVKAYVDATTGLGNVVDDTTPQLGGSLDVNGQIITSVSNGAITITPDGTGDIVLDGSKWPQTTGTSGYVLSTDGAGQTSWVSPSTGTDLVNDTTPQLGGNLDVNGSSIVSASNGDIAITPNGTGSVVLDGVKWPQADGTADYVLATDGAGQTSWVVMGTGGVLNNVSEDSTPQLGGNLDVVTYSIVSTANRDINISPNGTGTVVINTDLDVDNVNINGNTISSTDTNGNITLSPNGTGTVIVSTDLDVDNININGNTIITTDTNGDLTLSPDGTGTVIIDTDLSVDNLNLDGNTIVSTNTNGSITITPNGTGDIVLDGQKWPQADGSASQVLKTDGAGQLSWTTPASGAGAMVFIDSVTASSSSSISLIDCFSATYDHYVLKLTNIRPATDNINLRITLSTNSGTSWVASGYGYQYKYAQVSMAGVMDTGSSSAAFIQISNGQGNLAAEAMTASFNIMDPWPSTSATTISAQSVRVGNTSGTLGCSVERSGAIATVGQYDSIKLDASSGNLTSGTMAIYGIAKS